MKKLFNGIYNNKTVLITGHTGFKGSWISFWLDQMGANVIGYSLPAPTEPNHLSLLNINIRSNIGDIRDRTKLKDIINKYKPEIIFHMAAQPLVRLSYNEPYETLDVNVMGTANLLDICRNSNSAHAIINITSDKCYENREWIWGYRENDPMGGYDPYSVSKGCSELITTSFRKSFFDTREYNNTHKIILASVRAGNVIGGGDWAEDRLIPDIIKAVINNEKVIIRSPNSIRPWQHVLEPLSGYLMLGQKLLEEKSEFADGWNFGPEDDFKNVLEVVGCMKKYWDNVEYEIIKEDQKIAHEANMLKLDSSKANIVLKWLQTWSTEKAIIKTVNWYKNYYADGNIMTLEDIKEYIKDAKNKKIIWALK